MVQSKPVINDVREMVLKLVVAEPVYGWNRVDEPVVSGEYEEYEGEEVEGVYSGAEAVAVVVIVEVEVGVKGVDSLSSGDG